MDDGAFNNYPGGWDPHIHAPAMLNSRFGAADLLEHLSHDS